MIDLSFACPVRVEVVLAVLLEEQYIAIDYQRTVHHISHVKHTLAVKYKPYPTPPTTVAMMNQSLQSRFGTSGGGCWKPYGGYGGYPC
jgi:hypothetical protein